MQGAVRMYGESTGGDCARCLSFLSFACYGAGSFCSRDPLPRTLQIEIGSWSTGAMMNREPAKAGLRLSRCQNYESAPAVTRLPRHR